MMAYFIIMKQTLYHFTIFQFLILIPLIFTSCSYQQGRVLTAPEIIYPVEWGGMDSVFSFEPQKIEAITIHHSGVVFDDSKDVGKYLINLQNWSRKEKKWVDIPYHYIIDRAGRIYQCRDPRMAGDTNTEYDPKGHLLISVLGNYQEQVPTEQMLKSLELLVLVKAAEYKVDFEKIYTHQDLVVTECPGRNIVVWLKKQSWYKK